MKRIVVVVNPEKKDELEYVFDIMDVGGAIISNVQGFGNQRGITSQFRGNQEKLKYLSKLQAEVIVEESKVEELVEELVDHLQTGNIGDGKIFIYDVCDVVRIRTGERGDKAL